MTISLDGYPSTKKDGALLKPCFKDKHKHCEDGFLFRVDPSDDTTI